MNIAADDDLCTDDGVDVRGSVKGHRHGREALKGMLPYNIESLSRVFEFRMIPYNIDGEARAVSAQRHRQVLSLIGETHRNWFRCEHPLFTL